MRPPGLQLIGLVKGNLDGPWSLTYHVSMLCILRQLYVKLLHRVYIVSAYNYLSPKKYLFAKSFWKHAVEIGVSGMASPSFTRWPDLAYF